MSGLGLVERNFLVPIPGNCSHPCWPELREQRLRNLWAFLRHPLRVLKSVKPFIPESLGSEASFLMGPVEGSIWGQPGVPLLLFVRSYRANPFFTISLAFLRWSTFRASIYGTSPSCNCCRINFFVCVYCTLPIKTHDLPLPFSTL